MGRERQSRLPTALHTTALHTGWVGVWAQSPFLSLELGSIEGNCQSTLTSLWVTPNTKTLPKFCPGSL